MPASKHRFDVAVTGLGLVTSAGIGVRASWQRICAGDPTATHDPGLAGLPVDFNCRIPGFDADKLLGRRTAWRLARYTQLALVAAREALADAAIDTSSWDGARVAVVVGSALGGTAAFEEQHEALRSQGALAVSPMLIPMAMINMVGGYIAIDCGATGPNLVTATACASGATAIGTARELLRTGMCDVVITGGTEASLSPTVMSSFAKMGALSRRTDDPAAASRPFENERDGFVAAEGAGILVLETLAGARARGARVHACISGYGASADAHHSTTPDPKGRGAELAIRSALADAHVLPKDVDHVNAHGTSTRLNDVTEARVVHRVFGERPAVTSTKGVVGHSLGAAGAIEAVCTVLTVKHGVVPPTANLSVQDPQIRCDVVTKTGRAMPIHCATSNSFGFGGVNAALVVTRA